MSPARWRRAGYVYVFKPKTLGGEREGEKETKEQMGRARKRDILRPKVTLLE